MNTFIVLGIVVVFAFLVYLFSRPHQQPITDLAKDLGKVYNSTLPNNVDAIPRRNRPITKRRQATTPRAGTIYQEIIDKSRLATDDLLMQQTQQQINSASSESSYHSHHSPSVQVEFDQSHSHSSPSHDSNSFGGDSYGGHDHSSSGGGGFDGGSSSD